MREFLTRQGRSLWLEAVRFAQNHSDVDDRPLYWTRLCMTHSLRSFFAGLDRKSTLFQQRLNLLDLFDKTSRGLTEPHTVQPAPRPEHEKLIVISGFDPFNLVSGLEKSNTSGACVLALHEQTLSHNGINAKVMGAIFPVRYWDFDQGLVEGFFKPYLDATPPPDLVMTISQNQDGFKVERFAGRRRSTESFCDNAGRLSGGNRNHPIEPGNLLPGPEFIESSLPASTIRSALGRSEPTQNELRFMALRDDQEPLWEFNIPPHNAKAICGSGGGFLSNEIFYRTSLLRTNSNHPDLPMGHFHIPTLDDHNNPDQRKEVVDIVRNALLATLPIL